MITRRGLFGGMALALASMLGVLTVAVTPDAEAKKKKGRKKKGGGGSSGGSSGY